MILKGLMRDTVAGVDASIFALFRATIGDSSVSIISASLFIARVFGGLNGVDGLSSLSIAFLFSVFGAFVFVEPEPVLSATGVAGVLTRLAL